MSDIDLSTAALVLIDLQHGIVSRDTAPYPARAVVEASARLADAFRARGRPVILVTVGWAADWTFFGPGFIYTLWRYHNV